MPVDQRPAGPQDQQPSTFDRISQARGTRRVLETRLCRTVLSPARGDTGFNRFVRYSLVSGVAIVISQVTILVCTWLFHLSGIASNTIGALAATPASYQLNRKWAWGKSGKSHLWREVIPFWSLSLLGFLASTGTVELADNMARSHHVVGIERSLAIMGASLFAYGVIWVVKFAVFNRLFDVSAAGQSVESSGRLPGTVKGPEQGHAQGDGPRTLGQSYGPGAQGLGPSRADLPEDAWDEPSSVGR